MLALSKLKLCFIISLCCTCQWIVNESYSYSNFNKSFSSGNIKHWQCNPLNELSITQLHSHSVTPPPQCTALALATPPLYCLIPPLRNQSHCAVKGTHSIFGKSLQALTTQRCFKRQMKRQFSSMGCGWDSYLMQRNRVTGKGGKCDGVNE